jgi:regulator of protease activity HflC (stomatin/prohibitin superfamily)
VTKVDVRPSLVAVPSQEVLTSDGVGLKVTMSAKYEVVDPVVAINQVQNYLQALYTELQLALREVVGTTKIEDLLERRGELGARLSELAVPKAAELGLRLYEVEIKDLSFPGDLKKVFSQVIKARQEGLAALEKARGETAALRNLANAARLVEEKPALLHLRMLQQIGEGSGNHLVVGLPAVNPPTPAAGAGEQASRATEEPGEAQA